jgi:hypothetical protein
MASHIKEQKYTPLKTESVDVEDDSDSTLTSTDGTRKRIRQRRRFQQSNIQHALTWFRWAIIIILQTVIIALLWQNVEAKPKSGWSRNETETGGDINGLYIPSKLHF